MRKSTLISTVLRILRLSACFSLHAAVGDVRTLLWAVCVGCRFHLQLFKFGAIQRRSTLTTAGFFFAIYLCHVGYRSHLSYSSSAQFSAVASLLQQGFFSRYVFVACSADFICSYSRSALFRAVASELRQNVQL
jgi:hypothetical protein